MAVAIWLASVLSAMQILGAVGVALGMIHLDGAEQLVAEPDRMDDQAAHVGHRRDDPRIAPDVLDPTTRPARHVPRCGTARPLRAARRGSGRAERAAVGERRAAVLTR